MSLLGRQLFLIITHFQLTLKTYSQLGSAICADISPQKITEGLRNIAKSSAVDGDLESSDTIQFGNSLSFSVVQKINPIQASSSSQMAFKNAESFREFSQQYELNYIAAGLISSLARQTELIFDDTASQSLLQYILVLKALLKLLKVQRKRQKQGLFFESKGRIVAECKNMIHALFTAARRLRTIFNQHTSKIKYCFKNPSYQPFIQKILAHPEQTYAIFMEDQALLDLNYTQILDLAYTQVNKILVKKLTEIHLRLGLWILLCLKQDEVFSMQKISSHLAQCLPNQISASIFPAIDVQQIQNYLIQSDYSAILQHHRRLRKSLYIKK